MATLVDEVLPRASRNCLDEDNSDASSLLLPARSDGTISRSSTLESLDYWSEVPHHDPPRSPSYSTGDQCHLYQAAESAAPADLYCRRRILGHSNRGEDDEYVPFQKEYQEHILLIGSIKS